MRSSLLLPSLPSAITWERVFRINLIPYDLKSFNASQYWSYIFLSSSRTTISTTALQGIPFFSVNKQFILFPGRHRISFYHLLTASIHMASCHLHLTPTCCHHTLSKQELEPLQMYQQHYFLEHSLLPTLNDLQTSWSNVCRDKAKEQCLVLILRNESWDQLMTTTKENKIGKSCTIKEMEQ